MSCPAGAVAIALKCWLCLRLGGDARRGRGLVWEHGEERRREVGFLMNGGVDGDGLTT
jgi:hypothetical protein